MATAFQAIVSQPAAMMFSSTNKRYDVFINHHGEDVKQTLASTIYHMFHLMGVKVFLDKPELEAGYPFPREIEEAMRSASIHIAIFSFNYAKSPWCLEELSLMLQLKVKIIPVFFGVDPSDVRYAKGKYADAFVEHERKGRYTERIEEWKRALNIVSYLNGFVVEDADMRDIGTLSRKIVDSAWGRRLTFQQVQSKTLPDSRGQFANSQYLRLDQLTMPARSFAQFKELQDVRAEELTMSAHTEAQYTPLQDVVRVEQFTMSAHSFAEYTDLQDLREEQLTMSARFCAQFAELQDVVRVEQLTLSAHPHSFAQYTQLQDLRVGQLTMSSSSAAQFTQLEYLRVEHLKMRGHSFAQFSHLKYLHVEQLTMSAHSFAQFAHLKFLHVEHLTMAEHSKVEFSQVQYLRVEHLTLPEHFKIDSRKCSICEQAWNLMTVLPDN